METKPLINRTVFRIYQLVPIQFNSFPHNLFANLKKLHAFIGIYVYFIWLILSLRFEYGGQVNHSVFWLAPILRKPWTLFFQYVWFLFPICLLCLICAMYVTRINAVSWQIARQTFYSRRSACLLGLSTFARIACLLQLRIKTSDFDYSIWATLK